MEKPEKNDLFYQLMQEGKLHWEKPGLEEEILLQLHQIAHKRPARRNIRISMLFLSMSIILGLVLCALYVTHYPLPVFDDRSTSLTLQAMLVLTFLFLLEKILQLLIRQRKHLDLK